MFIAKRKKGNPMIKIVLYQDILADFYENFCRIFKQLWYATNLDNTIDKIEKKELDNWNKYTEKRWQLRFCGFRVGKSGDKELLWRAGYIPTVNQHGEVIFNIPMRQGEPEKIEHISLTKFLDMKKLYEIEDVENQYYGTQKVVDKVVKEIEKEHKRKDLYPDEDFISEKEIRE